MCMYVCAFVNKTCTREQSLYCHTQTHRDREENLFVNRTWNAHPHINHLLNNYSIFIVDNVRAIIVLFAAAVSVSCGCVDANDDDDEFDNNADSVACDELNELRDRIAANGTLGFDCSNGCGCCRRIGVGLSLPTSGATDNDAFVDAAAAAIVCWLRKLSSVKNTFILCSINSGTRKLSSLLMANAAAVLPPPVSLTADG